MVKWDHTCLSSRNREIETPQGRRKGEVVSAHAFPTYGVQTQWSGPEAVGRKLPYAREKISGMGMFWTPRLAL